MNELTISNISGNFSKLTNREREILEGICDGLLYKEIADKLTIAEGTVKRTVSNIYTKLGLGEIKSRNARMKIINIHFCPLLDSVEIPPAPEPPDNEILIIPPNVKDIVDDDEGMFYDLVPKDLGVDIPLENSPKGFQWKRDIPSGILAILVLLGLNSIFSLVNLGNSQTQGLNVEPQIEFVEVTVEVPKEVTVEVPQIIVATDDPNQPTQTARVEQKVVTATPHPPTPTESPSLVSEPGFIFSDNFDLGPDPAWEKQYGNLGMANGNYTIVLPFNETKTRHFYLLSTFYWDNINIEFKIDQFSRKHRGSDEDALGAIVLNYLPGKGGVGFLFHPEYTGVQFGTLDTNRNWTLLSSTFVGGFNNGFNFSSSGGGFRIEIRGNTYLAFIDNDLITSATIPGYEMGQVGIWMSSNIYSESPEYYAPRIEYITIESLP